MTTFGSHSSVIPEQSTDSYAAECVLHLVLLFSFFATCYIFCWLLIFLNTFQWLLKGRWTNETGVKAHYFHLLAFCHINISSRNSSQENLPSYLWQVLSNRLQRSEWNCDSRISFVLNAALQVVYAVWDKPLVKHIEG